MKGGRGALVLLDEDRSIWQEGAMTCLECPPDSYSPTVRLGFSIHGLGFEVEGLGCASLGFRARVLVVGSRCLSVDLVAHRSMPLMKLPEQRKGKCFNPSTPEILSRHPRPETRNPKPGTRSQVGASSCLSCPEGAPPLGMGTPALCPRHSSSKPPAAVNLPLYQHAGAI